MSLSIPWLPIFSSQKEDAHLTRTKSDALGRRQPADPIKKGAWGVQREGERERQRQTDRQTGTDRYTDCLTGTDRMKERERGRERERV